MAMLAEPTTPADNANLLGPYITSLSEPIYCLRNLPEEVVAVLFAYYSRATGSLRESLSKLLAGEELNMVTSHATGDDRLAAAREQAAKFHDKWVVGYGHASVAEHAVAHLAIEDCSIILSKIIEDTRLASYTEKSTRYVWFSQDAFVTPPELDNGPVAVKALFESTARHLMQTYVDLSQTVQAQVRNDWPRQENQSPRLWESQTKAKACDLCRYVLPAATRTNIGMTLNGRLAEHLIRKLMSHPLAEARAAGAAMKREVLKVLPTLVKYADPNAHMSGRDGAVREALSRLGLAVPGFGPCADAPLAEARLGVAEARNPGPDAFSAEPRVRCVDHPADPLGALCAAILFEHGQGAMHELAADVAAWSEEQKAGVVEAYLANRGRHDQPGRALEMVTFTFDILVDYGAFRDIQRHRICTQLNQPLGCHHGYALPADMARYGHAELFHAAMKQAEHAWREIAAVHGGHVAGYIVPLAYRKRTLFSWNLRSLWHFISLRSAKQGHTSYRRVAQSCWRELARVCPQVAKYVPVDMNDYALGRSGAETTAAV